MGKILSDKDIKIQQVLSLAFKHFALYGDYKPALFMYDVFLFSKKMASLREVFLIKDLKDIWIKRVLNEMREYNKFEFI